MLIMDDTIPSGIIHSNEVMIMFLSTICLVGFIFRKKTFSLTGAITFDSCTRACQYITRYIQYIYNKIYANCVVFLIPNHQSASTGI